MGCPNPQPAGPGGLMMRPCGVCMYCRINYARQKAVRALHELQYWDCASFLTLTLEDQHLTFRPGAIAPTLVKRDLQLFFKRLRKHIEPRKISYMACGEYGEDNGRPHYHVILYGENFADDRVFFERSGDNDLYTSPTLDHLWEYKGLAVIGDVTFDSANYVAGYTVKKLNGKQGAAAYENQGRIPPFGLSSRRPAIGKRWIEDYKSEALQHDSVIVNGHQQMLPRYYDEYIKRCDAGTYYDLKRARMAKNAECPPNNNIAQCKKIEGKLNKSKKRI